MSNYHHLTSCDREMIMLWLSHGWSITSIAKYLNRSKSTISREIKSEYGGVIAPANR